MNRYEDNYCLFSLRYFRSEDRNIHERSYPELHYPEIYLLEGGYKIFYEYSKVRIYLCGKNNMFHFIRNYVFRINIEQ